MTTNGQQPSTCRDVERRFEALLAGTLGAAERDRLAEHLAICPHCRDLAEVAGALAAAPAGAAPDLTAAVLARTAGAPCARARDLLCELVDGLLDATDAGLVRFHAARCSRCGPTAAALERLAATLPALAAVEPDARFTRDVLRATLGPDARVRLWAAHAASAWARLVTRPRFGLEAAYVGAMVLLALCGLPFSPLRDVPERALALAREGSVAVAEYAGAVGRVPDQVAALGDKAWSATGAHGIDSLRTARLEFATRYERTAPAREALRENGARLREAARGADVPLGRDALQDIGNDIGALVRLYVVTDGPPTADDPNEDPAHDQRPPAAGRG